MARLPYFGKLGKSAVKKALPSLASKIGPEAQVGPNYTPVGNIARGSTTPGIPALGGLGDGRGVIPPKLNSYAKSDDLGSVRPSDIGLPESPNYGKVTPSAKALKDFHKSRGMKKL